MEIRKFFKETLLKISIKSWFHVMKGVKIINIVKDLFLTIEAKAKMEEELKEITRDLKSQANILKASDFSKYSYEECRNLYKQIQYYIDDKNLLNELSAVVEKKKVEKYPDLLKPTYYPEIDSLDISDSEKLRLDKAARWNMRNYLSESNAKKMTYPLSIEDLEMLKNIGIVEKKYNFRCKDCGSSCTVISESDLGKYKRFWELFELEKQKKITDEQLDELNQLEKDGFYEIYLCCLDEDECDDIEITNEKELSDYMKNVEIIYKVVKSPDLTFEKL